MLASSKRYQLLVIDDEPADVALVREHWLLGEYLERGLLDIHETLLLEFEKTKGPLARFDGFLIDWKLGTQEGTGDRLLLPIHTEAPDADRFLWTKSKNLARDIAPVLVHFSDGKIPVLFKPLDRTNARYEFDRMLLRTYLRGAVDRHFEGRETLLLTLGTETILSNNGKAIALKAGLRYRFALLVAYLALRGVSELSPSAWFFKVFSGHAGYGTVVVEGDGDPVFALPDGNTMACHNWDSIWDHFNLKIRPILSKLKTEILQDELGLPDEKQPYQMERRRGRGSRGTILQLSGEHPLRLAFEDEKRILSVEDFWRRVMPFSAEDVIGRALAVTQRGGNEIRAAFEQVLSLAKRQDFAEAWRAAIDSEIIGNTPYDPATVTLKLQVAAEAATYRSNSQDDWVNKILFLQEEHASLEEFLTFEQAVIWDCAWNRANCARTTETNNDPTDERTGNNVTEEGVDIGIVVALREEFEVLFDETQNLCKPTKRNGQRYYSLSYQTRSGRKYRCVTAFVGQKGETGAARLAEKMIHTYDPPLIIALGIAAGIHKDIHLGDVLVADQVDRYFDSAAAVSVEGDYEAHLFQLGGRAYQCTHAFATDVDNLKFTFRADWAKWLEECRENAAECLDPETLRTLKEHQFGLQEDGGNHCVVGKLATGPVVAKSQAFTKWLHSTRDREVIALDMESGAVVEVCAKHSPEKRTLVIRGISDYGDDRKEKLEAITPTGVRRLAMKNAIRLLWILIETGILDEI